MNSDLEGQKWGGSGLGSAGGTVTWAVDGSVPAAFVGVFRTAFETWAGVADISFAQVASVAQSQIDLGFGPLDGRGTQVGRAEYSYVGTTLRSAMVTFDSAEGWRAVGSGVQSASGVDLLDIALHEIGHAIGLDHYDASPAIMNTVLGPSADGLTASDVEGITALYGARPGSAAGAAPSPAAPSPAARPGSDDLVDDAFYLERNGDVRAAGVDPDVHYAKDGWGEGRDPNAFFDTSAYLATYTDVRDAGVDPLVHYTRDGWREGRDPSGAFDTDRYRAAYGDVAAAGIDPLLHYLQYGAAEGRSPLGDGVLG